MKYGWGDTKAGIASRTKGIRGCGDMIRNQTRATDLDITV